MKTVEFTRIDVIVLAAACSFPAINANAFGKSEWILASPNGDASATTYLSTKFEPMTGSFPAMPASSTDTRTNITGGFLVGQTRTVLKMPKLTAGKVVADEIIMVNIIECKEGFYGTIKTIKKLKGNTVRESITPENEFNLYQATGPSLWKELCDLNAAQK